MHDIGLLGSFGRMRRRGKYNTVRGDMASKEERWRGGLSQYHQPGITGAQEGCMILVRNNME